MRDTSISHIIFSSNRLQDGPEAYFACSMHYLRCSELSAIQVFEGEGFKNPTDERHCVNSISIKYVKE